VSVCALRLRSDEGDEGDDVGGTPQYGSSLPTVFGVKELGGRRENEEERAYLG
jgi:hypothetical protein